MGQRAQSFLPGESGGDGDDARFPSREDVRLLAAAAIELFGGDFGSWLKTRARSRRGRHAGCRFRLLVFMIRVPLPNGSRRSAAGYLVPSRSRQRR